MIMLEPSVISFRPRYPRFLVLDASIPKGRYDGLIPVTSRVDTLRKAYGIICYQISCQKKAHTDAHNIVMFRAFDRL